MEQTPSKPKSLWATSAGIAFVCAVIGMLAGQVWLSCLACYFGIDSWKSNSPDEKEWEGIAIWSVLASTLLILISIS
jgi:hypothetical protein